MLKGMLFGLIFAGLFSSALYVFAVPPDSVYDFSETLTPTCVPGSTNCTVQAPAKYLFGTNNFSGTGSFSGGAITGTSFIIGANTISSFANLASFAGISYTSGSPLIKMTSAGTFGLDSTAYYKSGDTAVFANITDSGLTASKTVFTDANKQLTSTGIGTSSQFIKGDGSLDSSVYLTSLSGGLLATGATTGATSQSQVFTNGVTLSNLTSGYLPVAGVAGLLQNSAGTGFVKVASGVLSYDNSTYMANPMDAIGQIIYGGASGAATKLVAGSSGQILQSGGAGAPAWTTATYPATTTANQVLYSTASNTVGAGASLTFDATTLNILSTGTQQKLSYNGSIYSTFATGNDGTLTVANTGGAVGDIVFNPTGTGDIALLSDTGKMILGGYGNTNNEDLKFDFETTADTAIITSTTGVNNITWTGNLTLGGNATVGTLVTRVATSAPTEADVNGSLVVDSGDGGRIYFRYGGAWHYVAKTAGFQIPNFETTDPISGEKIQEGDIVLGMVNETLEDKALHGVWVKWDSVKAQLLAEARGGLAQAGNLASSVTSTAETMLDKVTNVLTSLGISIKDGVTQITQLAVERFSAKNARVETLEMVDKATGEVYCTWMENGEMLKAKGECGSIEVASSNPQPVGQSVQDAEQIINTAQQAASNALETTQQAQEAVEQIVEQQVQQEIQAQLEAQQSEPSEEPENPQIDTPPAPEPVVAPSEASAVQEPPAPEQPTPEPPAPEETSPVSFVSQTIRGFSAGLLNAIWEFTKWIFGAPFLKNSTASMIKSDFNALSSGINSVIVPVFNYVRK